MLRACRPLLPVLLLAGLAACSSTPDAPPPSLPAARAALDGADPQILNRYAPVEMRAAQDEVAAAEAAWRAEDYARSRRLSEQALATVRLAQSKAQAAQAEEAREDVARTINALQAEVGGTGPSSAGSLPPPAATGSTVPLSPVPTGD